MGGAWEPMIRSVRRVLSSPLTIDRVLTDEQLETFLLEVESVVNSLPLTPVTKDSDGETPLNAKPSSSSQRERRPPSNTC